MSSHSESWGRALCFVAKNSVVSDFHDKISVCLISITSINKLIKQVVIFDGLILVCFAFINQPSDGALELT
jgi:hypothetical protein